MFDVEINAAWIERTNEVTAYYGVCTTNTPVLNSITSRFTHCSNTNKSIEVNTIANLGHSSFVSERFIAINYYKRAPRATASRWFILIKLRDR